MNASDCNGNDLSFISGVQSVVNTVPLELCSSASGIVANQTSSHSSAQLFSRGLATSMGKENNTLIIIIIITNVK